MRLKGRMAIDGTGSNSDAIGSTIKIKYKDGQNNISQIKQITSGESFISANALDVNFGLGKISKIDEIVIIWPTGKTQSLTNVKVNQILEIIEEPN